MTDTPAQCCNSKRKLPRSTFSISTICNYWKFFAFSFIQRYIDTFLCTQHHKCKDTTTYQRLGHNSLMWYTGLPVRHSLPNPIVVWTNEMTCSLSSLITKLSYMFSHWSRPQLGLAIHAIMRGWVHCTQFQQNSLISGHVFDVNLL